MVFSLLPTHKVINYITPHKPRFAIAELLSRITAKTDFPLDFFCLLDYAYIHDFYMISISMSMLGDKND